MTEEKSKRSIPYIPEEAFVEHLPSRKGKENNFSGVMEMYLRNAKKI